MTQVGHDPRSIVVVGFHVEQNDGDSGSGVPLPDGETRDDDFGKRDETYCLPSTRPQTGNPRQGIVWRVVDKSGFTACL
jgi:hypothetical protein